MCHSISRGKSYQLVILPISIVWLSVYWGDNCLLAAMFSGSLRVFSLPSHNEQAPLSGKFETLDKKNGPALDSGQSQCLPQDATLLMAGQHSLESTSSSTIPSDRLGLSEYTPIPAPDKRSNEVSVGILLISTDCWSLQGEFHGFGREQKGSVCCEPAPGPYHSLSIENIESTEACLAFCTHLLRNACSCAY